METTEVEKEVFKKAMHVIQILEISSADPENLILSDLGNSEVAPAKWISWLVLPNTGVKDITAINVKPNSINVFQSGPCKIGNSANWRGQISSGIKEDTVEDYSIIWLDEHGIEHTFDPRIRVNPNLQY